MDENETDSAAAEWCDTNLTTAQREQRRAKAIEAKLGGATYPAIAEQFGYYDRSHARRDILEGVKEVQAQQRDTALALTDLMWERYERLLSAHWPAALLGDPDATQAVIRITEAQIKLRGLAAAVKVDLGRVQGVFEQLIAGASQTDDSSEPEE
jgi:hypothetical protein